VLAHYLARNSEPEVGSFPGYCIDLKMNRECKSKAWMMAMAKASQSSRQGRLKGRYSLALSAKSKYENP
jgi:hypothetical protein